MFVERKKKWLKAAFVRLVRNRPTNLINMFGVIQTREEKKTLEFNIKFRKFLP